MNTPLSRLFSTSTIHFTGKVDTRQPVKINIGSMLSGAIQRNEVGP